MTNPTRFGPENGGNIYLRNVGSTSNIYLVKRPMSRININSALAGISIEFIFWPIFLILKKRKYAYEITMFSVCLPPLSTFECQNQSLWNLVCISWHLSPSQRHTFFNPYQSVCLHMYPLAVPRQRLGKHFTEVTNTHATIKEVLDLSFSMRSVSYKGKYAIINSN
jgi:hypothetical protein